MSDDIVTRLRTASDEMELGCLGCSIINQNDHYSDCLTQNAADEIERLRGLLMIFDTHFVCEECDKACATYLQGCENPLHALHTAAWERF